MATTKIWKVQKRLDHVIDYATNEEKTKNKFYKETQDNFYSVRQALLYATNPDKTEKKFYTTGINCEVENAIEQMIVTKKKYKKEKGILAFHAYQSFAKGEVTPEVAHEIGVKLAEEMWGDRFEIVVSTHLNTQCIHNHFVLNSVSFKDGYKYYSNLENTALFRKTSDDICDEFGLKVLDERNCKSGINFENFYRKSLKNSDYYNFAKEDIDYAIKQCWSMKQFETMLKEMGYQIYYRAGKISIRREPYKRSIRIERAFGEEYSIDRIKYRILYTKPIKVEYPKMRILKTRMFCKEKLSKRPKAKGIRALYLHYCYLLKVFPKKNLKHKSTPEMRAAIKKMDKYSEQNKFICRYNITNTEELKNHKKLIENNLKIFLNERDKLYYQRKKMPIDTNKDEINKRIEEISKKVTKVRTELKVCNQIKEKTPEIKLQLKEFYKKENEEKQREEQNKAKKKARRWER